MELAYVKAMVGKSSSAKPKLSRTRRGTFLLWLRNTHGYIGLWGAGLGLLFGATGFLLNHKHVMKLPVAKMEQSQAQLTLPVPPPSDANALAQWLQSAMAIKQAPFKIVTEPGKIITWSGVDVQQPALWKVDFHNVQHAITTEYWVGNHFVSVKRQEAGSLDFITRLHKGLGMGVGWVLLADSLAGALILLSITGVLLWTKMRKERLLLLLLGGGSIGLGLIFTMQSL
ncbi:MAG: PepSY-associated TM helix domain-containing protein [Methylotenera sp.]|nr:PepSY-associated TM helix domain-containing protein [Methylotenera sp.]